jgi:hypothetical protein
MIFSKFSGNFFLFFFWEKKNRGLKKFCVSFFLKEHENLSFRNLPEHSWGLGRRGIDDWSFHISSQNLVQELTWRPGDQPSHSFLIDPKTLRVEPYIYLLKRLLPEYVGHVRIFVV